jgi:ATP-dependent Clp protease protease subunit
MRFNNEFEKYAIQHIGIGSSNLNRYKNSVLASQTPYILEEREMRVTQLDIFSRMMLDREIWFTTPVTTVTCTITQAQLMFLDSIERKDIKLNITSPGGEVCAGLSLLDTMNYVLSDISTINLGMAASMGSILVSSGTKGKRFSLKHSRIMIHQVSSAADGVIMDMRISLQEAEKYNDILFNILAENTNKTKEQILNDSIRDKWFSSQEAVDYGLIDGIVSKKK